MVKIVEMDENVTFDFATNIEYRSRLERETYDTSTFLNKCGDITVFGRTSAMLEQNSGLLNACLKCPADSHMT